MPKSSLSEAMTLRATSGLRFSSDTVLFLLCFMSDLGFVGKPTKQALPRAKPVAVQVMPLLKRVRMLTDLALPFSSFVFSQNFFGVVHRPTFFQRAIICVAPRTENLLLYKSQKCSVDLEATRRVALRWLCNRFSCNLTW